MKTRMLYAGAIVAVVLGLVRLPAALAQQQGAGSQPGVKWTEEQLNKAVAPARVGRKLTPKAWPNRARVAVCLSFDVDNESYLLARGETSPTTLSAADFGAETGLPRILELLDRHQVPASFFIPAVSAHPSRNDPRDHEARPPRNRGSRLDPRIPSGHQQCG